MLSDIEEIPMRYKFQLRQMYHRQVPTKHQLMVFRKQSVLEPCFWNLATLISK